ncbi:TIGR03083 family protein [Geodermatophilus telluris]|uniref:TIGR03083 family protein n=1 Tax=Geodermatophilus telluris TaxID=1190417 RepID=A0A1G6P6P0_9ACTN|nr:maleylpyruvate isomerase family mycothiol-dependent enzyme [Geodermatophilus telluris]SDC75749.1 TIGR03083 family protein [Geodermatophilus telluris]
MTEIRQDVDARVHTERTRLLHVLDGLDEEQWDTPSLCAGWSVRDLVLHVLMPYEVSTPRFLQMMLRARFDFDRAADRWATTDTRTPAEVVAGLRETAHRTFNVPGAPVEAPLSHLVIHAQDVYRPLGVPSPTDPENARVALEQLTSPRARRSLPPGILDGLAFSATDTDWRYGKGAPVSGPATALLTTLSGRTAALPELAGAGVADVRARL